MDFDNVFDFGDEEGNITLFSPYKKEKEAKAAKEGKTEKPAKKATNLHHLPVTIITGYFPDLKITPEMVGGKADVPISELKSALCEKYPIYAPLNTVLDDFTGKDETYKCCAFFSETAKTKDISIDKEYKISLAGFEVPVPYDEDEEKKSMTGEELLKLWTEQYPDFKDAVLISSKESATLVPIMKGASLSNEMLELPLRLKVFGGEEIPFETIDGAEFGKIVGKKVEDLCEGLYGIRCNLVRSHTDSDVFYAVPITKNSVAPAEIKAKETMYPTDCVLSLMLHRVQLTPEMFGGKKEVTEKEMIKYIQKDNPEFATERTYIIYDAKAKLIIPQLKAAKKGCADILDAVADADKIKSLEEKNFCVYNVRENMRNLWRVEKNVIGTFKMKYGRLESEANEFHFALPTIPSVIWYKAVYLFKKYARKELECMVQILYNTREKRYALYIPKQTVSACGIEYETEELVTYMAYNAEWICVMDFHSHHTMAPFWSAVDDWDEKATRLYAVFGSWDNADRTYDIIVRAVSGRMFCRIPAENIFEDYEDRFSSIESIIPRVIPDEWLQRINVRTARNCQGE